MKAIKKSSLKSRRKFDETFKREAVNNWLASGMSAEVVSEELGLSPGRLFAWKRRFAPADAGGSGSGGEAPSGVWPFLATFTAQRAVRSSPRAEAPWPMPWVFLGILSEPPTNALNVFTR